MKYDIDLDPNQVNTSHGVIIDMVGTGKRVLDVGCSTGYLAKQLAERGNTVVGIEIDEEAAAQAEQWVERCVVGDLEKLDLTETLGTEQFDIIVFADVLEHLADPIAVLREAKPLLRPGGGVIVSIPNVAHGAVRLALLEGRFDYRPIGLLDETHLRFFTRETVEDLFGAAGLVAVERRRTTADVFATEIPLDARQFSAELIESLQSDPDSTTYQFVVRAVPSKESEATKALATELIRRDHQIRVLQDQIGTIMREAADLHRGPAVGMVIRSASRPGGITEALRVATVTGELRRRLGGFAIQTYAVDAAEPSAQWTGEAVHPLLPWSAARGAEIAAAVDALVVCGDVPLDKLPAGLDEAGCPVLFVGVAPGGPASGAGAARGSPAMRLVLAPPSDQDPPARDVRAVPDPLLLASRLHGPAILDHRRDYLRLLGQVPEEPYAVVALPDAPGTSAAAVARSLDELARRAGATLVLVTDGPAALEPAFADLLHARHVPFHCTDPVDLLALISGSQLGVTDSAAVLALATALRRPFQALSSSKAGALADLAAWLADPDVIADRPAALLGGAELAEARAADQRTLDRLIDILDLALDDLASEVQATIGRRAATAVPVRLRELVQRVAVQEAANMGLQQRMADERVAFGSQARELLAHGTPSGRQQPDDTSALEAEIRVLRFKYEQVKKELDAVYATKTMRVLKPARDTYARLRSGWK